ncbi:MAG: dihydroorotate dehydrogenase electron transfer subunit [Oscillospiraceae bacterium]|jgi:dihydroorotate dehydrogenase electron transfer subunit|nr:dihydroorotate dehydrogenase electron transfer subunit [Oscillospiraceae bacterium]
MRSIFTVTDIRPLASGVFAITFDAPELARAATPGQFVHIKCGHSRPLRRPFGICDVRGDMLTVAFEVRGDGTRWLAVSEPGRRVDINGPLGHGFSNPDGDILLVGGGLGAAPLLFAARRARGRVSAILGFRSDANAILREEFDSVCEDVFVATEDGSSGLRGTVVPPLEELMKTKRFSAVLACGPRPMLRAVADISESAGVKCEISLEERMGCGVGACLVCVCETQSDDVTKMSRVCRDGPVFDSREVVR